MLFTPRHDFFSLDAGALNNQIQHSAHGIVGDLWQRQSGVLLRGNTFEDVTTEFEPVEAGYLKFNQ